MRQDAAAHETRDQHIALATPRTKWVDQFDLVELD